MTNEAPIDAQQHEPDAPALHFLVDAHVLEHGVGAHVARLGGQARALQQPAQPLHVVRGHEPGLARHRRRHQQARAHRLAMQPLRVAGGGLQRVPERVAEVQQRAVALLALVAPDDLAP